jgi:arylsulfatase A-like enzyme
MGVGVAAGFLELAVFAVQVHGLGRVGLKTLTISRHVAWMTPVAEVLSIGGLMLVLVAPTLAWTAWRAKAGRSAASSSWSFDWAGTVLGTMLVLGPLLAIRGLHSTAALVLAVAIGARLRRWVVRPSPRWRLASVRVGGVAFVVLIAHATWQWSRVAGSGDRAWGRPAIAGPNLLWIVMDTVRADRMGLYGYDRPTTPSLDRWAREGITFDAAYSAAPWTLPSHMTMFTGLWPFEHGARVDRPYAGPAPTLAEHLAGRGYTTAGIVANTRMCNDVFGVGRGFDTYVDLPCKLEVSLSATLLNSSLGGHLLKLARRLGLPVRDDLGFEERHPAPEIVDRGRAWLEHVRRRNDESTGPDRPFFLFLNFMDAHGPYLPAPHVSRRFWTDPIPDRSRAVPQAGWLALQARDTAAPDRRPGLQRELDEVTRRLGDLYDDCLLGLDGDIGRFLGDLRGRGLLDNTWVVITADHGEHLGEHGRFGHVSTLYNELTRVPLVLIPPMGRDPGGVDPHAALRGRRVGVPVSHRDLPATLTELLDPQTRGPFPGRSLASRWGRGTPGPPGPVISQLEEQSMMGEDVHPDHVVTLDSLVSDDHILIRLSDGPPELYRRREDPRQRRNLAGEPEGEARRLVLQRELDAILRKTEIPRAGPAR